MSSKPEICVTEKNPRIFNGELPRPIGPFSPAVRAGDFVLLSGMIGQDAATGQLVAGGVAEQARQIFHNLDKLLRSAGKTRADAVKVNVYLVDMDDYAAMNEVYSQLFSEPYPARTTIAVAALPLGARIEVELVAR